MTDTQNETPTPAPATLADAAREIKQDYEGPHRVILQVKVEGLCAALSRHDVAVAQAGRSEYLLRHKPVYDNTGCCQVGEEIRTEILVDLVTLRERLAAAEAERDTLKAEVARLKARPELGREEIADIIRKAVPTPMDGHQHRFVIADAILTAGRVPAQPAPARKVLTREELRNLIVECARRIHAAHALGVERARDECVDMLISSGDIPAPTPSPATDAEREAVDRLSETRWAQWAERTNSSGGDTLLPSLRCGDGPIILALARRALGMPSGMSDEDYASNIACFKQEIEDLKAKVKRQSETLSRNQEQRGNQRDELAKMGERLATATARADAGGMLIQELDRGETRWHFFRKSRKRAREDRALCDESKRDIDAARAAYTAALAATANQNGYAK